MEIAWFMILTFLFLRENWIVCMKNRMFLDMCCHMTVYLFFQWLHIKFGWVIEGIIIRICQNIKYLPKAPRALSCPKLSRKCTSMSNWYRHNYHYSAKGRWFSLFPLWRPSLKPTKLPAALHVPWTVHILLVFKRHLSCDCQDDDFVLVVWSGAGMRACWDQARSCCAARGCKHCKEHASVENIEPCTSPAGLWSSLWRYTRRLAVEDCQGGVVLPAVGKSSGTGTGRQRGHLLARPFSEDRCARIKDAYFLA